MKRISLLLAILIPASIAFADGWDNFKIGSNKDQILDKKDMPDYGLSASYVDSAVFEGHDAAGIIEIGGDWSLNYIRDVIGGNLDIRTSLGLSEFTDDAGMSLPDHLLMISLDMKWSRKFQNDLGMQIGIAPGIYTDTQQIGLDAIYFPFSLAMTKAFTSDLTGIFGLQIRPGFDRSIMPLVGCSWKVSKDFQIDAMLPESRIIWRGENASVYLNFKWRDTTYAADDTSDETRESVSIGDMRFGIGAGFNLINDYVLNLEIGKSINRNLTIDSGSDDTETDIEDAIFYGVSLQGRY